MISVIVPVYNVEKYIDDCVRSIINQTYKDLEIILIDDGSTDTSGQKCDEWANSDSRISVYHKPNGGLMSAWKYGVAKASGDYIGFVDSDDWIDPDMYDVLYKNIISSKADLALCALVKNFENKATKADEKETLLLQDNIYNRLDIEEKIYPIAICSNKSMVRGISPNRVTKLYKRELLMKIIPDCPDDVSIGEDLVSTFSAITNCQKICVVHDFYPYHYRINNNSMIQRYSDLKYEKIKKLNNALICIDAKNEYDFGEQIANDYIRLIFENIEQEILFSGYTYKKLKADIKKETTSELFISNFKKSTSNKYNKKIKLYTFLSKLHLWGAIILIRRLYKTA